jgi:PEP-CTERM motif-containing protein
MIDHRRIAWFRMARPNGVRRGEAVMKHVVRISVMALSALIAVCGPAFAGVITKVPEPASLGLLAVGAGAVAAVKYFRGK